MDCLPNPRPLLVEQAANRIAALFRRHRVPFFSALVLGFLAYGFILTNKLINHDEAHSLFAKGATVTSGRWGLGALDTIFPNYSMPWIYGLLTIVLVAVCACVLVSLFSIRSRLLQGILAGCVTVFPSLIGLLGYMFTSCSFALSFLLAIVSAALLQTGQKRCILPAAGCLIFSLSIYQSYVSVTAGLLVLLLIRQILTGSNAVAVLRRGIFYVFFLIASLAAYYLCTQLVLDITGTKLGNYASGNFTFHPSGILKGAAVAYENFLRFFMEGFRGLIPTGFSRRLHTVLLGLTFGLLIWLSARSRLTPSQWVLLAVLVCLLPLAINCMYMITAEDSIHTLVLYSFVDFYLLILILADLTLEHLNRQLLPTAAVNTAALLLSLIIVCNIYIANQAALHLHLRYENAYAFYTSLMSDIRKQPEFTESTRLAVIGNYQQPEYYSHHFEHLHEITGVYGFLPDSYSKERFVQYYLGFPISFASDQQIAQIRQTEQFQQMPVYPYHGSLDSFGDILVVKLS